MKTISNIILPNISVHPHQRRITPNVNPFLNISSQYHNCDYRARIATHQCKNRRLSARNKKLKMKLDTLKMKTGVKKPDTNLKSAMSSFIAFIRTHNLSFSVNHFAHVPAKRQNCRRGTGRDVEA